MQVYAVNKTVISNFPGKEFPVIKGASPVLPCGVSHDKRVNFTREWRKVGIPILATDTRFVVQRGGGLRVNFVRLEDTNLEFSCHVFADDVNISASTFLVMESKFSCFFGLLFRIIFDQLKLNSKINCQRAVYFEIEIQTLDHQNIFTQCITNSKRCRFFVFYHIRFLTNLLLFLIDRPFQPSTPRINGEPKSTSLDLIWDAPDDGGSPLISKLSLTKSLSFYKFQFSLRFSFILLTKSFGNIYQMNIFNT